MMSARALAIPLIKKWEGLRLDAYLCPAGKWTIGWGHTGPDAKPGAYISQLRAEKLLSADIQAAEKVVLRLTKAPLNDSQIAALISFVFNFGAMRFAKSTLLKKINLGDFAGAADEFPKWVNARDPKTGKLEPLPGLVKRRAEERSLFLSK